MTTSCVTDAKLNVMKSLLAPLLAFLFLATASTHAASDADVTLIKARKVVIEDDLITIIAEAKTRITLIQDNHDPAYKGAQWMGRPVASVHVKSDKATFIIKRPQPGVESGWQVS